MHGLQFHSSISLSESENVKSLERSSEPQILEFYKSTPI